jgi:hypothetical protein
MAGIDLCAWCAGEWLSCLFYNYIFIFIYSNRSRACLHVSNRQCVWDGKIFWCEQFSAEACKSVHRNQLLKKEGSIKQFNNRFSCLPRHYLDIMEHLPGKLLTSVNNMLIGY